MNNTPELIVMLTHHDHTVENAELIFEQCKNSKAKIFGFKEQGIPLRRMRELFAYMKACGKTIALEIVAYSEEEGLEGARMAAACGCDILMGTVFFDSILDFCKQNQIRYMPFVGKVSGRPSVLEGSIEEMIVEAESCLEKGVYGFDLLGYRYTGNAVVLNKEFVSRVDAPVCLAGSVNSLERLSEVKDAAPWAFTVGGALFENKFGNDFMGQIDYIYDYMHEE